jgi:hypothetical protein
MPACAGRLAFPAALLLACLPSWAPAQPVGAEFQVNTHTTNAQRTSFPWGAHLVASDAAGNFVVVWSSDEQDGSSYGVFGQRYDDSGQRRGSEFRVNTTTVGSQQRPSVAAAADGDFVVAWEGQDGSSSGIFAQRFDAGGARVGTEFRVNSVTASTQSDASIASDAAGNFVVVWRSYQGSAFGEVYGRRYDAAGNPQGPEFRVNSYTTGFQYTPSIASAPAGNFVVAWASFPYNYQYGRLGVFAQRYDSSGQPQGGEFRVNGPIGSGPPSIASDAAGNFVVAWQRWGAYGGEEVYGRRFDSAGTPRGTPFHVNSYTPGYQESPSVASDSSGNFVVVWESQYDQDGNYGGIFGQRYDSAGTALGGEFQVNVYTTGVQAFPSVGATGENRFVVVWESDRQDGGREGVFGRRYGFGGASLTVVSPNANLQWRIGSVQRVKWTHALGPHATFRVDLDRDDDGDYEELIAAEVPVDDAGRGFVDWTVSGPPSGTARVRVSWTQDPDVSDASDVTFQIRPAPLD